MSIKRLLIIFSAIFFLQSCGLKFWYNRLDWLVSWQVDDFVELSSKQEDRLEALVREKLQWHRSTQLPRYVELIDSLIYDIEHNGIAQNYDNYRDSFIDFYRTIATELSPQIIEQISQLKEKQIDELMRNINDEANKQLQKFKKTKPEKRLKKVRKNIEDGYKEWVGRLTKEQKNLIKQWVNDMQPTAELRFEYGNLWRLSMDYALRQRQTPEGKQTIKELILEPRSLQKPELKSRIEFNAQLEKNYALKLYQTITKKQQKRFIKKLKSYRNDFQDLIHDD